jgi:hypothetical protein
VALDYSLASPSPDRASARAARAGGEVMDDFVRVVLDLFRETEGRGPVWDEAVEQLVELACGNLRDAGEHVNTLLILAVPLNRN